MLVCFVESGPQNVDSYLSAAFAVLEATQRQTSSTECFGDTLATRETSS